MLLGLADYALRLLSELPRHFLMPPLHFFVRDIELLVSRAVGRDLRSARAAHALPFQMFLDLLTARTRRLHVLPRVALDFRLAARPLLHFVTQPLQAQAQLRTIDGRRVLLRTVQLPRLQRPRVSVVALRHIE